MNLITNKPAFVIVSAYGSGDKVTDISNHNTIKNDLDAQGVPFKSVQGCYKGNEEYSFYIELSKRLDLPEVLKLANQYNQESILYVDSDRNATLVYICDCNRTIDLGTFTQVSRSEALECDAYTYDYSHNAYYICK